MAFKILVTSQKGGVGKSTLSANLVAYLSRSLELPVTLIDWDPHGSSSNWLKQAPQVGAVIQHLALPVDQGGNRPIFEARLQMRRAASECDILVCDLTWSDSLAGELMFEFDMVLVPTRCLKSSWQLLQAFSVAIVGCLNLLPFAAPCWWSARPAC